MSEVEGFELKERSGFKLKVGNSGFFFLSNLQGFYTKRREIVLSQNNLKCRLVKIHKVGKLKQVIKQNTEM
jgi:hypothetical protein